MAALVANHARPMAEMDAEWEAADSPARAMPPESRPHRSTAAPGRANYGLRLSPLS